MFKIDNRKSEHVVLDMTKPLKNGQLVFLLAVFSPQFLYWCQFEKIVCTLTRKHLN